MKNNSHIAESQKMRYSVSTMKLKNLFTKLLCALVLALSLTGCLSTSTDGSVAGGNRGQLLLVSEEQLNESARISYAQVLAEAKAQGKLNTSAATTARVKRIADRLIAQVGAFRTDATKWKWEVNVITDDTINAWCMPGGKIVVYTGIIQALNLTDGELAAVMGHEIAHALREHSREQASQELLRQLGVAAFADLTGMSDTGTVLVDVVTQCTISLPHSRTHETEADVYGTELMARAGYDPHEAVNIWKKMSALNARETPEILSTHPSNSSRISNLTQVAEKVYPLYLAAKK